eukprot:13184324-Ditylum_brightwellii.AAC.1
MEPEAAGSRLDTTIGADLTALKRTAEGFIILQYYTRSMRIMDRWNKEIGSRNNFAGPFVEAL